MIMANTVENESMMLDSKELYFLASLLETDRLLGVDDPFRDFLIDTDLGEWEDVRKSLISKGYLIMNDNEEGWGMPLHLSSSLKTACNAEKACWLKFRTATETIEQFMHITDERIVNMERSNREPSLHRIDEISEVCNASGMVAGKIQWNKQTPDKLPALMLSKRQFEEVASHSDELDVEQILSELSNVPDDQEAIMALAKCLKTCLSQGDLRFYAWNGSKWDTQSARFLINHHMNWLIRTSTKEDEDWLIATPTPMERFLEILQTWFHVTPGSRHPDSAGVVS
ncbi:hypothetical protein D3C74_168100 [compost metagenome]